MPALLVSIPLVYLQDIGVVKPCLARQVQFSVSGPIEANIQLQKLCEKEIATSQSESISIRSNM